MIEINGVLVENAFPEITVPKGKYAIFNRLDVRPLKRFTDQGVEDRYDSTIMIPAYFTTRKARNIEGPTTNFDTINVRYYESKSEQPGLGGGTQTIYFPTAIEMKGTHLKLDLQTVQGKEIYKVLMAHCLNKANSEVLGKKPEFEWHDAEAASKAANAKKQLRNKAIALAYDEEKVPESLAVKIHKNLFRDGLVKTSTDDLIAVGDKDTLRSDISDFASSKPDEFMRMVADANLGLRAEIKEAVELGVLIQANEQWSFGESSKERKNKVITVIPVGEDPINELMAHFIGNVKYGKKALEEMRNDVITIKKERKTS